VDLRERLPERLADPPLVLGVRKGEEEAHRDGLDVGL
jgi:hypothetical protein